MPEWRDVCGLDELDAGPRIVDVEGTSIGIQAWRGRVYAVVNRCGHNGAPMGYGEIHPSVSSDGPGQPIRVDDTKPEIRCPWHHWGFDLETGICTAPVRRPRLRVYETRVEDGRVWVNA